MEYRERAYKNYLSEKHSLYNDVSESGYRKLSKSYRWQLKDYLPTEKDAAIIDIACGQGTLLYALQDMGYTNMSGIDMCQEQVDLCSKMGVKNVVKADLFEYMNEREACFDLITCFDMIEHLTKDEIVKMLDIFKKALKADGRLLISTCNADNQSIWRDFTHETGFTPMSIKQVLRLCDFKDVHVFGAKPVPYGIKGFIRSMLWAMLSTKYKIESIIKDGAGFGIPDKQFIFETRMYAVAGK